LALSSVLLSSKCSCVLLLVPVPQKPPEALSTGLHPVLPCQQAPHSQTSGFLLKKLMANGVMPIPKQMGNKITTTRKDFHEAPSAPLPFLLINNHTAFSSFSTDHHSFLSAAAPRKPFSKGSLGPVAARLWDLHNTKTDDFLSLQLLVFLSTSDEREREKQ